METGASSLKTSLAADSTRDRELVLHSFRLTMKLPHHPATSCIQVFVQADPQPSRPSFSELSQPHLEHRIQPRDKNRLAGHLPLAPHP